MQFPSRTVKTRKPHRCWGCAREMATGSMMKICAGVDEYNDFYSEYWCQVCNDFIAEYGNFDDGFELGGIPSEYPEEWGRIKMTLENSKEIVTYSNKNLTSVTVDDLIKVLADYNDYDEEKYQSEEMYLFYMHPELFAKTEKWLQITTTILTNDVIKYSMKLEAYIVLKEKYKDSNGIEKDMPKDEAWAHHLGNPNAWLGLRLDSSDYLLPNAHTYTKKTN